MDYSIREKQIIASRVSKELEAAMEAQICNNRMPKLSTTAAILMDGEFDLIPKESWAVLGMLLAKLYKKTKGRPKEDEKALTIYTDYIRLQLKGMTSREAIVHLTDYTTTHGSRENKERVTRDRIKRGEKINAKMFEDHAEKHLWGLPIFFALDNHPTDI